MGLIRRSPPLGTTGGGASELIKAGELDNPKFTPKPRIAQPNVGPGRIIRTHYLRPDEWPTLDQRGASA